MKPFKPLERVKFYGVNEIFPDEGLGTVIETFRDGLITVRRDDGKPQDLFHPKQLRRVKRKCKCA